MQEAREDREILKVATGGKYYIQRGKIRLTADFLIETIESSNCELSVLLHSAKILVRNEDFLLIHVTNIPVDRDSLKGRKKISGRKSGI